MKTNKVIVATCLAILLVCINAKAQFIVGPGFSYNSASEQPGAGLTIGAIANEKFKVTAGFTKYLSDHTSNRQHVGVSSYSSSQWRDIYEINFNLAYIFKQGPVYIYPMVGMNILKSEYYTYNTYYPNSSNYWDYDSYSTSWSNDATGVNVGAGAQINLGLISPFIEGKYSISREDNATVTAGVLFNFGRKKVGVGKDV